MKKVVIYYSMSGNTEYVAKYISKKIDVDLLRINSKKEFPKEGFKKFFWGGKSVVMKETPELEKYKFNADEYDHIIFGTPVWASTFTPPIRTFIKENKDKLKDKKISVYVSCMGGGAEKAIKKLQKYLGVEKFNAELILIDPLDNKTDEKDEMIDNFCKKIR